ncbi:proteasome assembly chaperone 1 isoform X2 [Chelmon rostratus]|uniref:proteasome assembly chaperone 1 isoform X2 n=1 Tax=Chelmon rostratus TaxID=109905 RepID=UPI001BE615DD|nr:proteasome assembly chaperone 1 isoform X2 [Chelmon rostratus]
MATFFGEVLSVYSRAVEEDDEDLDENEEDEQIRRELEEKREVHLHWSPEVSESLKSGTKLQCSDFVLAVGHNAARFLSVYVLTSAGWDTVGHASVWNERSRPGQTGEESACVFYRQKDNPSVLICQVTCYVAEDQLHQWTEKVFDCSSAPFLRSLHTGAFSGQPGCRSLEQPNIVTGLPAAVLNHCEVHRIAAVVYQCYSDVIGPDSVTMETYKPALTKLGKSIQLDSSPSTDVLRKFVTTTNIQSNLYI